MEQNRNIMISYRNNEMCNDFEHQIDKNRNSNRPTMHDTESTVNVGIGVGWMLSHQPRKFHPKPASRLTKFFVQVIHYKRPLSHSYYACGIIHKSQHAKHTNK